MFGIHKELPGREFTTVRALGLRERMVRIPLIVDDLNNRKMAEHLPDLVKADRDFAERYAPILISTNKDVQPRPRMCTRSGPIWRQRRTAGSITVSSPRP